MTRRRSNYNESCWRKRTRLELALIGVLLMTVIFAVVLTVLLTLKRPTAKVCDSPQCIAEASQIAKRLDLTVQPCQDFHKFSCGKTLNNKDIPQSYYTTNDDAINHQLSELYSEPIEEDDDHMVAVSKMLFKACMDEEAIELDGLRTIKEVLRLLGGWPVVEGVNWDDTKFNWIQATYRLRKLGYPFGIFLDLSVTDDPRDSNKYMYRVSIPRQEESYSLTDTDKRQVMKDVAILFGANRHDAAAEMRKIVEFEKRLNNIHTKALSHNKTEDVYNVRDFQEKLGYYVSCLEFINTIIHPVARISEEDYIIFSEPAILKQWFKVISSTSKRDQANYMMWRIIEKIKPYLNKKLRNFNLKPTLIPSMVDNHETRLKFCIREAQERVYFNPVTLPYIRRYLTIEKKTAARLMVNNIRQAFIENLEKIDWIDDIHKQRALVKAQQMVLVLGVPEDYLDENIFQYIDSDVLEIRSNTFLSLLSQANKNYKTNQYKQIHKLRQETNLFEMYIKSINTQSFIQYNFLHDIMWIPLTSLQGEIFDEDRPSYMNYGILGTMVAKELTKLLYHDILRNYQTDIDGWFNRTLENVKVKLNCVNRSFGFNLGRNIFEELLGTLAMEIVNEAYKKSVEDNGPEPKLMGLKYDSDQLLWITSASTICQLKFLYENFNNNETDQFVFLKFYEDFAHDFQCSEKADMKREDQCHLF